MAGNTTKGITYDFTGAQLTYDAVDENRRPRNVPPAADEGLVRA